MDNTPPEIEREKGGEMENRTIYIFYAYGRHKLQASSIIKFNQIYYA